MSRRSQIANDVLIRGQKRDNISVTVDGTKTYGACPNRMDPPVSHVLTNNIATVEVIEGPYDVSEYGNLGGGVKIKTLQPQKGVHGVVSFGGGSWGYQKISATISGGNDVVRVLVAGSSEESNQYKDGDGNTLAEQLDYALGSSVAMKSYINKELDAYKKQSFMTKIYINPTKNQEIRLGYTANRSNDVLYPNSGMDAYYDDSDIYNIEYELKNIAPWYKYAVVQFYSSDVDHPMGTKYRNPATKDMVNHMYSSMDAWRLKNRFEFGGAVADFGLEAGNRNWDGEYSLNGAYMGKSINDVATKNYSAYFKIQKQLSALNLKAGLRYDDSTITPSGSTLQENSYSSFGINLFANYELDGANSVFFGLGQAQRVPDARELYFQKSGNLIGTQNLEQVTNQEVDMGYRFVGDDGEIKLKGFYSMLQDYIYVNSSKTQNIFENIDASIYGFELSGSYYVSDALSVDMSASYKVGKKEKPLQNQSDTDLADIAPLQGRLGMVYDYMPRSFVRLDTTMRDRWSNFDGDNGEQELASWGVVDLKVQHSFNKNITMNFGVNNILDKTYARSNTYKDLTLVATNTSEVMLLNEPGRYIYTNFDLRF